MIFSESKLNVADNSGVKYVKCLKVFKGKKNGREGKLNDMCVVSLNKKGLIKKNFSRKVFFGIVTSTKKWHKRKTGIAVRSNRNNIFLLENKNKGLGRSFKSIVSTELKNKWNEQHFFSSGHFF